jgi:hypothetical protein
MSMSFLITVSLSEAVLILLLFLMPDYYIQDFFVE